MVPRRPYSLLHPVHSKTLPFSPLNACPDGRWATIPFSLLQQRSLRHCFGTARSTLVVGLSFSGILASLQRMHASLLQLCRVRTLRQRRELQRRSESWNEVSEMPRTRLHLPRFLSCFAARHATKQVCIDHGTKYGVQ